jgi:hypothetical protein
VTPYVCSPDVQFILFGARFRYFAL